MAITDEVETTEQDFLKVKVNGFTFDFSNVNLATGEGMQLKFNSLEEMDAYADAFIEACDKAGITL